MEEWQRERETKKMRQRKEDKERQRVGDREKEIYKKRYIERDI